MITLKEYKKLLFHLLEDMSYSEEGTFNYYRNDEHHFNQTEANKVKAILKKMFQEINNNN